MGWPRATWQTHDKPAFNLHLANPIARFQAGVKESYADFPHISDRLCVLFLYHEKKVNQRRRGIDIIIFKNLLSWGTWGTMKAMFYKEAAKLWRAAQYRKHFVFTE